MLRRTGLVAFVTVCLCFGGESVAASYKLKPGQTLADVAADIYGSSAYDQLIAKHNKIVAPKSVATGTEVKVPELKEMLFKEGIAKRLKSKVTSVTDARYTYMRHREAIIRALRDPSPQARLNEKVRGELRDAATSLEKGAKALAKEGKHADSPTRMKGRLLEAAGILRAFSKGKGTTESEEKLHKLFAQAFVRAIMWARGEDGE